jgi:hypothetical protein
MYKDKEVEGRNNLDMSCFGKFLYNSRQILLFSRIGKTTEIKKNE